MLSSRCENLDGDECETSLLNERLRLADGFRNQLIVEEKALNAHTFNTGGLGAAEGVINHYGEKKEEPIAIG